MIAPRSLGLIFTVVLGFSGPAWCEDAKSRFELLRQGKPVTTIAPIFGQLLKTGLPVGFEPISFEKTNGPFYIRESVLNGETVQNWSQMVTTTGMKDLALKPGLTPKIFLDGMAQGFRRKCPFSFNTLPLNDSVIGGSEAAVAVVSCGITPAKGAENHSESALIAVIKGQADYYTVQWAERAAPSSTPAAIDGKKWTERFNALKPIKLCPIIPGEKMPFPSCVGSGEKKPT
jgi:hypothetical protein